MKRVTTVEMQSRLCESLVRQDGELIQVTYRGKPVVAVLAEKRYHVPQASASDQSPIALEVTREVIAKGQRLFHSYLNRLAPRFQGSEQVIKIIEVTPLKKPVGRLLAWNDWPHLSGSFQLEEPLIQEDHPLQVVAARNHLLKLPEQFACEE